MKLRTYEDAGAGRFIPTGEAEVPPLQKGQRSVALPDADYIVGEFVHQGGARETVLVRQGTRR
jgi:hypothetical protein